MEDAVNDHMLCPRKHGTLQRDYAISDYALSIPTDLRTNFTLANVMASVLIATLSGNFSCCCHTISRTVAVGVMGTCVQAESWMEEITCHIAGLDLPMTQRAATDFPNVICQRHKVKTSAPALLTSLYEL